MTFYLEIVLVSTTLSTFLFQDVESTLSGVNCSKQPAPTKDLPKVGVFVSGTDEETKLNNGSIISRPPEENRYLLGFIELDCNHTKPIRWTYNLAYHENKLSDSHSMTKREVENFYDPSTYKFRADIEVPMTKNGIGEVLACMAFDNPCERTVVQASYDKSGESILQVLSKFEENQKIVEDLDKAIAARQNQRKNVTCDLQFSLTDFGNIYEHSFVPEENYIAPRSVPDRQTLENSFLYTEHLNPNCRTYLYKEYDKVNSVTKNGTNKYWPIVFFANETNASRVVYAYHTLHGEENTQFEDGTLKLSWEDSNMQDMMKLELPSKMYTGERIEIKCHTSPFYFSFGTLIGYRFENESLGDEITFFPDIEEDTVIQANRIAITQIDFLQDLKKEINVTIFCFSPIWDSPTDWGNISKTILLAPAKIKIAHEDYHEYYYTYPSNATFDVHCAASGNPVPMFTLSPGNISGITTTEKVVNNTRQITITISNLDKSHVGIYVCNFTNFGGSVASSFQVRIKNPGGLSSTFITILTSIFGAVAVLFCFIVVLLILRYRMQKEEYRRLTEEAMRDFFDGMDTSHITREDANEILRYANDSVKALPYDKKYEVSHRLWSIHNTILGSGAFGVVRKGQVVVESHQYIVAVKTVRSSEDIDYFRATLLELKIMAHVGTNENIVKLIAASTEEIAKRNVFIGVEFCANGDLLTYLQKRKKLFTNFVKDGRIRIHFAEAEYENTRNFGQGQYMNLVVSSDISTTDLYRWALHIARGMEFLESKKVLHADLAARNILLTEELVAKISDFGLSRDLFKNSEYFKKTQVALPWKWMAIESLRYLKFSSKSDVWGFGVALFEIFTLGEDPYPGMTWNEEFIALLENGMRLERPIFCTQNLYDEVMRKCWEKEPDDRIGFSDAVSFFEKAVGLLTSSPRKNDECCDFC